MILTKSYKIIKNNQLENWNLANVQPLFARHLG